ncbi:MAG TPA: hypothetical protein VLF66_02470 [Thermoanaerobaculia bacterium]|nr:hypothetical protein [Thermoanaerobaculia bacterium]
MPHSESPESASPEALEALVASCEPELQSIFDAFGIPPADQEPILHVCLVKLGLEWQRIEIDRKVWLLAEVSTECRLRTEPPPRSPRSGDEGTGSGGGGRRG